MASKLCYHHKLLKGISSLRLHHVRNHSSNSKKSSKLKSLLTSPKLEYIMEAHNGLSARIVEETGFKAIWASGLSISAQFGLRDRNEASWTQVLQVAEFMSDATDVPILLDADTGFGNFNNARRLVKKLEQIGVAGVCLEDKLFPKTNSLHQGQVQKLADVEEFSLKIKACKDSQSDSDFVVVARVEALIAGLGMTEAIRRATAYSQAGADAILIHSKMADVRQIRQFMKEWTIPTPVVVVPTTYYTTPTDELSDLGISAVIWANHNLRASIRAMQNVCAQIYEDRSVVNAEAEIVSVKEVFRLQREDELKSAEKKYLPVTRTN